MKQLLGLLFWYNFMYSKIVVIEYVGRILLWKCIKKFNMCQQAIVSIIKYLLRNRNICVGFFFNLSKMIPLFP